MTDTNIEMSDDSNITQIEIVCRQTSYTYEEAKKLLSENNNNIETVIKLYLGIKKKQPSSLKSTTSQERYKVMREYLDNVTQN